MDDEGAISQGAISTILMIVLIVIASAIGIYFGTLDNGLLIGLLLGGVGVLSLIFFKDINQMIDYFAYFLVTVGVMIMMVWIFINWNIVTLV